MKLLLCGCSTLPITISTPVVPVPVEPLGFLVILLEDHLFVCDIAAFLDTYWTIDVVSLIMLLKAVS